MDVSGSESPVSGTLGKDSLQEGTKRVRFDPPFIQIATMGLSVATTAILFKQRFWKSFRAKKKRL